MLFHDPEFLDESVFDSFPHFCGKEIPAQQPVDISFDDFTSKYKVTFTPDQKGNWKKANFLFDYTTSIEASIRLICAFAVLSVNVIVAPLPVKMCETITKIENVMHFNICK